MKIWSINFEGIWPVGSAAIVCTADNDGPDIAEALFKEQWAKEHPNHEDVGSVRADPLDARPGVVFILNDGDY